MYQSLRSSKLSWPSSKRLKVSRSSSSRQSVLPTSLSIRFRRRVCQLPPSTGIDLNMSGSTRWHSFVLGEHASSWQQMWPPGDSIFPTWRMLSIMISRQTLTIMCTVLAAQAALDARGLRQRLLMKHRTSTLWRIWSRCFLRPALNCLLSSPQCAEGAAALLGVRAAVKVVAVGELERAEARAMIFSAAAGSSAAASAAGSTTIRNRVSRGMHRPLPDFPNRVS
mmetsp:Transcript_10856/g.27006  ORF Transcript_10856/g.27006 Transcript_10856/m.27006 type:complete len:224 (+) Transcript_10856:1490-2161(+)